MGNVFTPLPLPAAASEKKWTALKKNSAGSGKTIFVILNKKMNYVFKIVTSLEDLSSLIKVNTMSVEKKSNDKEKAGKLISMLLGTLGANLII